MSTLSLTPLFRTSVGFDRFNDLFESAFQAAEQGGGYPPYNIEKHGDDDYQITMAVAGFTEGDLDITVKQNELTITGQAGDRQTDSGDDVVFLHRGIAQRAFQRTFRLADYIKVDGAELRDGLLRVSLRREVPEEARPRQISITRADGRNGRVLDHDDGAQAAG